MRENHDRSQLLRELAVELTKENPDRAAIAERARQLGLKCGNDLEPLMIEVLSQIRKPRPPSKNKPPEVAP